MALRRAVFSSRIRRWLRERKLTTVGESCAAHVAVFPTASGVSPWKVQNRRVGHPSIGLER